MFNNYGAISVFCDGHLSDWLRHRMENLKESIRNESKDSILSADEEQYVSFFTDKFEVESLHIDFDSMYVTDREEMIPAEMFDTFRFNVRQGQSYPKVLEKRNKCA
jgi:hypothetical protein